MRYTELQITSNFSFLRGGSHPEELVEQAAALGYSAIAITDRNSLAGIVRAYAAAKKKNIRLIPAARLDLLDGPGLLAYPTNTNAYAGMSNLLTRGNLHTEKGSCHLYKADVYAHAEGSKFIVLPLNALNEQLDFDNSFKKKLQEYKTAFGSNLYINIPRAYAGDDFKQLHRLQQLSQQLQIPLVATNDVHYHIPARRELQDILTCIREKCTIHNAGFKLHFNAERFLKPMEEMERLFRGYPDARMLFTAHRK